MQTPNAYIPSQILPGSTEFLREHSFTSWMSADLLQAATDFCGNIGLIGIYSECSPDFQYRYLFWSPPQGTGFEVRSHLTKDQFEEIVQNNRERGWPLLSLHINENDIHSAVWISPEHYDTATAVLASYGITPAQQKPAA